jgi:hypothetical protein
MLRCDTVWSGRAFLQPVGKHLKDCMASHPRGQIISQVIGITDCRKKSSCFGTFSYLLTLILDYAFGYSGYETNRIK